MSSRRNRPTTTTKAIPLRLRFISTFQNSAHQIIIAKHANINGPGDVYGVKRMAAMDSKVATNSSQKPTRRTSIALNYQGNHLFQAPNMIRNTRFHRGSDAQAAVDAAEIVVHEVKGDACSDSQSQSPYLDHGAPGFANVKSIANVPYLNSISAWIGMWRESSVNHIFR